MNAAPHNELPVIACSLPAGEFPERRERWQALTERALISRSETASGVRLSFRPGDSVEPELEELAALERGCCSFARFEVRATAEAVVLDVIAPSAGIAVVREIFA
jgi:hypothetical protein